MRRSSGPVRVVEGQRDTRYLFPERGTGGTLTVAFMKYIPKRFLLTLEGRKGLRDDAMDYTWQHVPFVNLPFESEIHGTVNFTYFCCVLLVTWCHRVLLSCYLRPK